MSTPSLLEQCGATQRRLLEALRRQPDGLSVEALTVELGITANAVRQHLAVLERDGLVVHEAVAAARGRPQFVYQLSEMGQEAFPRRYRELAEALLSELGRHLNDDDLKRAMRNLGASAAAAAELHDAPVALTARLMKDLGYEAEGRTGAKQGEEIVALNCVFHRLAERYPAVCEFDLGFMEAATGRRVEHRECMVRGGHCCRFGLLARKK